MAFEDTYRLSVHAVICNEKGQVLQLKQTYGNCSWGLPGGAVDPGETVIETLSREGREELGAKIEIGSLTGIYYHKKFNSHAIIFRCQIAENSTITLSSEHSDYRYFDLSELSEIQRIRVTDCLRFTGTVQSAVF